MKSKVARNTRDSTLSKVKRIRKNKLSPNLNRRYLKERRSEITADTLSPKTPKRASKIEAKGNPRRFQASNIHTFAFSQIFHKVMVVLVEKCKVSYMTINQTLALLKRFFSRIDASKVNLDLAAFSCFLIVTKFYEYWGKVRV